MKWSITFLSPGSRWGRGWDSHQEPPGFRTTGRSLSSPCPVPHSRHKQRGHEAPCGFRGSAPFTLLFKRENRLFTTDWGRLSNTDSETWRPKFRFQKLQAVISTSAWLCRPVNSVLWIYMSIMTRKTRHRRPATLARQSWNNCVST